MKHFIFVIIFLESLCWSLFLYFIFSYLPVVFFRSVSLFLPMYPPGLGEYFLIACGQYVSITVLMWRMAFPNASSPDPFGLYCHFDLLCLRIPDETFINGLVAIRCCIEVGSNNYEFVKLMSGWPEKMSRLLLFRLRPFLTDRSHWRTLWDWENVTTWDDIRLGD